MTAFAPVQPFNPKKNPKANRIKIRLTHFDLENNITKANALSETDPTKSYNCIMEVNRMSCECEDFHRTLTPCKHLMAVTAIVVRLYIGLKPEEISPK